VERKNAAELARLRLLPTLAEVKAAVAQGKDKAFLKMVRNFRFRADLRTYMLGRP